MKSNNIHFTNFKIKNSADNSADIYIYDDIGESIDWNTWSLKGITYTKFEEEFNAILDTASKINIRVNSTGGDVHVGLSIYNLISRNNSKNIHIYIDGVAYSMAAIITQAVKKENIHMSENAMLMLHSASGFVCENMNATDLREMADVLEKYDTILSASISNNLGITKEEVMAQYFDGEEHYFTPEEALSAGLINDIVKTHESDVAKEPTAPTPVSNKLLNSLESMVQNIKNKLSNHQTPKYMNLDTIKAKLIAGAVTAEEAKDMAETIDKFNSAKITEEEQQEAINTAVSAKETELNTALSAKDTEIADLKAKLEASIIASSGQTPAGSTDTPPAGDPPKFTKFNHKSIFKQH